MAKEEKLSLAELMILVEHFEKAERQAFHAFQNVRKALRKCEDNSTGINGSGYPYDVLFDIRNRGNSERVKVEGYLKLLGQSWIDVKEMAEQYRSRYEKAIVVMQTTHKYIPAIETPVERRLAKALEPQLKIAEKYVAKGKR